MILQDFWNYDPSKRRPINYYEFGVGGGGTLIKFLKALKTFCRHLGKDLYHYHIFLFDSFEGLPKMADPRDNSAEFYEGFYAHSVQEIETLLKEHGVDLERATVHFVKGFYNETLTEKLREKLRANPPSIVTIDVDYYSSTKTVLDWLVPILSSGTLFYFDDVWSFFGNPNYGELAAIHEFNKSGQGFLTPFPVTASTSLLGHSYIFSRPEFEFKAKC